ncbi:hypothetical protein EV715DRAFT_295503 [Schizophyllum commune]
MQSANPSSPSPNSTQLLWFFMGVLLLGILRLLVDILQACALSNIPNVARYVIISIVAVVIVVLICNMLAPSATMHHCDKAHEKVTSLLADAMERGESAAYAGMQCRLATLSARREEIARAIWGPSAGYLSFPATFSVLPWACAALWLLYRYHGLSEDIKDLARTIQYSRASGEGDTPRAEDETMSVKGEMSMAEGESRSARGETSSAGGETDTSATMTIEAAEDHEMHVLGNE